MRQQFIQPASQHIMIDQGLQILGMGFAMG
jgi:hypothetical protein